MDIDTLIERQEVLVENQKQLLSAMVSTLDLMKAEKLRQEIDQEIAFDEPNIKNNFLMNRKKLLSKKKILGSKSIKLLP